MRKIEMFLFAISMFLIGIYAAVMLQSSDSYFFVALAIAAPILGVLSVIYAFLPPPKKQNKDDELFGKDDSKKNKK